VEFIPVLASVRLTRVFSGEYGDVFEKARGVDPIEDPI